MSPVRRPTHYGQLLAYSAAFLFCAGEDVILWRGVKRYESVPYIVSAIIVTCMLLIVACAALGAAWSWGRQIAADAWIAREMAARPLGPTRLGTADAEHRDRLAVVDWAAAGPADVPDVDPDAARRARPSSRSTWGPDNPGYTPPPAADVLDEAWHAAREAERAAA